MFADLHLHTHFSDGTWTPEDLASAAHRLGLGALALTDHDTVEGCARAATACERFGLEFVPGTELTAEHAGHEVHLLGYFVDPAHPALRRELERFQQARQERIREMVARLNRRGVPLAAEAVFALANCRAPGRPHVARALVRHGFCGSLDEAFERFLKKHRPAWVPKYKICARSAVALIHAAGGLAVLAHPGLNHDDGLIPSLLEAGLDGLECWHSKHSAAQAAHYLALAHQYRLLPTGGSDCHGTSKGHPVLGSVRLAEEHYLALKHAPRPTPSATPAA